MPVAKLAEIEVGWFEISRKIFLRSPRRVDLRPVKIVVIGGARVIDAGALGFKICSQNPVSLDLTVQAYSMPFWAGDIWLPKTLKFKC